MASAVAPPKTPPTTTSAPTNPMYAAALAQAKAALAAAQKPIQAEQAQSDQQFQQRQTDATGEAAALADLLKGIAPGVQGAYTTAAQNQGLLGDGFSQGMKDALQGNTDNLNSMLDKLGSPAHLDSHATEAGDVTYGLGGYIPGSTFNREGAAFGAAAHMLPATALLSGQEQVKSLRGQAILADKGFQDKLAEMAGQLPGMAQDNYAKLQQLAMEDKKFALAVQHEKFAEAMAIANNRLASGRLNLDITKFKIDTTLRQQTLQISAAKLQLQAQKFAAQTIQQDRQYQLALAQLGIQQKSLQLRVAAQEYKLANGGFSPSQINKFNSTLQQGIDTMPPGTTYTQFVTKAVENGVPLSLAIQRANAHWPATQRPDPGTLGSALDVSRQAAAQATQWNPAAYNQMVGAGGGPVYRSSPGRVNGVRTQGNLVGVHVEFFSALAAAARDAGATVIQITSGRRSPGQNAAVGGVSNSNHLTGNAVDGRALVKGKWVPLGKLPTLSKYGIRSGDQPGFFNGKPDPYHVDSGANVGGMTGAIANLKRYAFARGTGYGWKAADMKALDRLWTRESGWNPHAKNPKSGALGIPQALGHKLPPGYEADPQAQIDWGLNYIHQRYGTPSAAWRHETRFGWY